MNIEKISDLTYERIKFDFLDKIDTIVDDDIRNFVADALDNGPKEFWKAKSSSSGNNHAPENNIEGGLLVHIIKALEIAEGLFRFFGIDDSVDEDIVRASILLHDLYKQGNPWGEGYFREHGRTCADVLAQYTLNEYIKGRIMRCVGSHMSRWTYPMENLKQFIIPDNLQIIVALSDYMSSRNEISFYPNISILGTGKNVEGTI
jgi:hypothetical protein